MSNKDDNALHMAYAEGIKKLSNCLHAANSAIEVLLEFADQYKKAEETAYTLNNKLALALLALNDKNKEIRLLKRELDIEKTVALELASGDDKWLDRIRARVMSRPEFAQ